MGISSELVLKEVENCFPISEDLTNNNELEISDALLVALTKLLIAPDDQVRIATNANAAMLHLCKYDHYRYNIGRVAQRLLASLHKMWRHIQNNNCRELTSAQIRIASLMIDTCLLGDEEFSYALLKEGGTNCIMDELLYLALDTPNKDPLLQMSALDQLERLAVQPVQRMRAEFLLGNDSIRNGLLYLVGGNGDEDEMDPVNGPAALRLLTEICRVGVSSSISLSIEEKTLNKFHELLKGFHVALQRFHPQGELEKLSFIHAVSSLFAFCSLPAFNSVTEFTKSTSELTNYMLRDRTLLHEWLSLHTRVSQPKLKSTVLCSMAQVLEPVMWNNDSSHAPHSINTIDSDEKSTRPNDVISLQLYQAFSDANFSRDATEVLLTSAKSPFVEERLGAYTLLNALVMRGATLQLLLLYNTESENNSFLEWLLNQENESTIEGRLGKYQIVSTMLSRSGSLIAGLIPPKMARELETWNKNGPHYGKSTSRDMATE